MKKRKKSKFFKKHELFKVVGICMIIAALLTWVMEVGLYQGGEFVNDGMYRVGIFDFLTYSIFSNYYFPTHFLLLIITAGFYKFLGSLPAYQKLTDDIARRFKKIPAVFAIVSSILLAAYAGVAKDYFAAIALIPFFVTILSKLKVERVVGAASTLGGVLIGILASSYSEKVVGALAESTTGTGLGIKYGYQQYPILILFAVSLLLLGYFIWRRCSKQTEESNLLVDPFGSNVLEGKDKKQIKRIKTTPLAIMLVLFFFNVVLGLISWESQFGVTLFKDIYESINSAVLFGEPVFQYILGNVISEFGTWDLLTISIIMLITTFLIKLMYSVPFDKILDEFAEGVKKIVPTLALLFMLFAITLFTRAYPTVANLVHGILESGTSIMYVFASGIVNTLFSTDFSYSLAYVSTAYTSLENLDNVALALQSAYGLVSLVAPTSLVLMTGLSMLNVRYSEWLKFIWKFAVLVLILIIAVLLVL